MKKRIVINLCQRTDKLARFLRFCPWPDIEVVRAFDGRRLRPPPWFRAGDRAWGCYRSHVAIIERALNEEWEQLEILEDDAIPRADFATRYPAFLEALPADAGLVYYGGQHLYPDKSITGINAHVWKPFNVHRCHAWCVRRPLILEVYEWLCNFQEWWPTDHIDHHFGKFQQRRFENGKTGVYCPADWLFDQMPGMSDIQCEWKANHRWPGAEQVARAYRR